jgi:hypothetical protein
MQSRKDFVRFRIIEHLIVLKFGIIEHLIVLKGSLSTSLFFGIIEHLIVLKFGMYLGKYNLNDYKSSKTELLELFQI